MWLELLSLAVDRRSAGTAGDDEEHVELVVDVFGDSVARWPGQQRRVEVFAGEAPQGTLAVKVVEVARRDRIGMIGDDA